jgi:hypothetical protein
MYMYYLLGFNLLEKNSQSFLHDGPGSSPMPTVDSLPLDLLQQVRNNIKTMTINY